MGEKCRRSKHEGGKETSTNKTEICMIRRRDHNHSKPTEQNTWQSIRTVGLEDDAIIKWNLPINVASTAVAGDVCAMAFCSNTAATLIGRSNFPIMVPLRRRPNDANPMQLVLPVFATSVACLAKPSYKFKRYKKHGTAC